jgi:hypothetical protein
VTSYCASRTNVNPSYQLHARGVLRVLSPRRHRHKSALLARDADLLTALAAHAAAQVCVSVTRLDGELARRRPCGREPARSWS